MSLIFSIQILACYQKLFYILCKSIISNYSKDLDVTVKHTKIKYIYQRFRKKNKRTSQCRLVISLFTWMKFSDKTRDVKTILHSSLRLTIRNVIIFRTYTSTGSIVCTLNETKYTSYCRIYRWFIY